MKKLVIASAALMLTFAPALAHTTRHHHSMTKGMTNGSMHKGSTSMGTTGTGHGTTMRPDASGQGGSGPGSDQGGTRVSPGAMK